MPTRPRPALRAAVAAAALACGACSTSNQAAATSSAHNRPPASSAPSATAPAGAPGDASVAQVQARLAAVGLTLPDPLVHDDARLAPTQALVLGHLDGLNATDAQTATIPLPVTITVPERGVGSAEFLDIRIDGAATTIRWDAGQPLPLTGTGAIDLGPADVDVATGAITWHLDHGQRLLRPGRYVVGTSVAVGRAGLATPRDGAAFDAVPGSGFITNGDARIVLSPQPLGLTGPATIALTGTFAMATSSATTHPRSIRFGPGPMLVAVTPTAGGGFDVAALLQGPVTAA
jgi:hypothetical protein